MNERKKNFLVFGLPPLLWMLIILGLSSIPGKYIPKAYALHQAAHFTEYSIFGVLLARGFAHLQKRLNVLQLSILTVILGVIFAFLDEWRQSFVPGRSCNLSTVFFDMAYIVVGVFLYDEVVFFLSRKKRKVGV